MKNIAASVIIHEGVVIEDNVTIHDYVVIYPGVVLKKGVEIFDHSVIGKLPKAPGCTSREIKANFRPTIIGENTILSPSCVIYSGTQIGHNSLLGDFCSIREDCTIGDYSIISRNVSVNYNTIIGNHTKIMDNSHITGNAIIEDNVFISVLVATTNDNTMGREQYSTDHVGGPHIKKGTTIGAGALVTKNVPNNKVVMGLPARIIRDVE